MARVLVVDDENLMRTMVEVACRRLGHEALCAATLAEGRRLAATGVDVILLDMLLPDGNGLDAQQELAVLPDAPDIVVITGHGDGDAAEKALRGGVWDFLMKPVRVRDVEETLSHVLEARDRRRSRRGLELEPGQVAGSGPAMQAALAQLEQAAHSDVNVLLLGETGVGKDEIARFIHQNSGRSDRRFVPINCGAITESLFESELFGHEGHAFTGAGSKAKPGLLEAADHGTLFLDEVGELSLNMQTKLLHVLQNRSFIRVGGNESVQVDIRVIAATNCDLEEMVRQKRFREDLYYRLNVIPIHIPPLRKRKNDIIPLAQHFLDYYNQKYDFHRKLSPATCFALLNYRWEGNVRQLKNSIEQATIITDTDLIQPESLPMNVAGPEPVQDAPAEAGLNEMLERMELRYLQTFYERYGSIRKAAERLKLPPTTFLRHWERLRQKYGTSSAEGKE